MNNICYGCMEVKDVENSTCPICQYDNIDHYDAYYIPQGTIINEKYLIGRVLGHGGFGITYIGIDQETHEKVAIKEYFPGEYATRSIGETKLIKFTGEAGRRFDEGLSRFYKEGKLLEKYNHVSGIVSAKEVFRCNGTAYIVMEYIDGITLEAYLNEAGGSIPYESAISIMGPVMDSLKEIHKSGLIHRDISPDNIYITTSKQVKLIDFGAAKQISSFKAKSMSVILKQGYAPEEQYRTKGKQGPWTDVYAVSATIYRMITGQVPIEPMERSIGEDIEKPTAQGIRIPDRVEKTLLKGLAIKSENRYQSIVELQNSLLGKTSVLSTLKAKIFNKKKSLGFQTVKILKRVVNMGLLIALMTLSFFVLRESNVSAINVQGSTEDGNRQVELNRVIVPDVRGFHKNDATYIFEDLSIIVKYVYDYNEDVKKNCVVSQSYINKYVGENQLIVLTVSKGSKEIVTFSDPNLEDAVRKAVGKVDEPIYVGDVLDVEELNGSGKNINNLSGLEKFTNLKVLTMANNPIKDISPIYNLQNLEYINFRSNLIERVNLLNCLNRVIEIDLSSNAIQSINISNSLNNAKKIDLSMNKSNKVSIIGSLNSAYSFNLSSSIVSELEVINSLSSAVEIDISNNFIKTIDSFKDLKKIERLVLHKNSLEYLPDLENFKELKYLDVSNNRLKALELSSKNPLLRYLDASNNFIEVVESLEGVNVIQKLFLKGNKLKSISGIDKLTLVEELDLSENNITSLSNLSKLKSLRSLDLSNNLLSYVSGLRDLPKVKEINLSSNQLRGNGGISNLPSLEKIDFSRNNIEAVSMLTNCPNVTTLDLSKNHLTYVRNIYKLKKLEILNLSDNRIVGIFRSLDYNNELKNLNLSMNNPVKRKYKTAYNFSTIGSRFDVSFIRNLPKLEILDISYTNTQNISSLDVLTNLKELSIFGNPAYNTSNQKVVTDLQGLGAEIFGFRNSSSSKSLTFGNYTYIYGVSD